MIKLMVIYSLLISSLSLPYFPITFIHVYRTCECIINYRATLEEMRAAATAQQQAGSKVSSAPGVNLVSNAQPIAHSAPPFVNTV